ncbi:hypothetical protein CEUSTIGMA_g8161.t1 [Chlamydomonas eustigma]|uniref:DUF7906 domain-containing protein n=1 Tax=Chlamydomonas eustigma TaxID=1157962 RepID=A0A250XCE4_9CHLO|nr:hypothetical protein CEUSTIGMA_g8161.t1 [Chlamydomonas eustigma]|eukprot:GAX80726.1 hypothetical protein CEUSTIGMA_g8161.t1 [Chlamydomonas eustigma]
MIRAFLFVVTIAANLLPAARCEKKSGSKFFDESITWDNDELSRIRVLHNKNFFDKEEFNKHSNVAEYLGLSPVEAIHMPVPLTIVFVGFSNDGNMGVDVSSEGLSDWFSHIDHILPHSRIELADLSCSEDGYCAGLVHGHHEHQKPVHSAVHLNFTCRVMVIQKRAVMATFERAIHAFSRPVDPHIETGAHQVDAKKMEAFINHFVESIGLIAQYTIVVVNPTWSTSEPAYGYRQGVSDKELEYLQQEGSEQMRAMLRVMDIPEPALPDLEPKHSWWGRKDHANYNHNKFSVHDASWVSNTWVEAMEPYLKSEEDQRSRLLKTALESGGKGAAASVQAVRVMRRMDGPLSSIMIEQLLGGGKRLYSNFRTAHPAEDCLVSHWVGLRRWIYIDLTASGNDWGPALGGDGVVNKHSMPRVSNYFGPLAEAKKKARLESRSEVGSQEADMHAELMRTKSERQASTANSEYQAFMLKRKAWDDSRAPGAPPVNSMDEVDKWGRKYKEALLRAELDTYHAWALRHCHQRPDPPMLCADIKEDVDKLRAQLSKLVASGEVTTELHPTHMWDIFGMGQLGEAEHGIHRAEGQRVRDLFMAEMAGIMSKAIRHVIAPPTAVWRHGDLNDGKLGRSPHDVAPPFAKRVLFDVYVITERSKDTQGHFSSDSGAAFDIQAFFSQVQTLQVSGAPGSGSERVHQAFRLNLHQLNMEQDYGIATAFAVSLRTGRPQIPSTQEHMEVSVIMYVDSRELEHHLWPILKEYPSTTEHAVELTVPVFIFRLQRHMAVLIDEHYSAKALENMIIVISNAAQQDEHPTGMMCNGALMSRSHAPEKEALGAVLQFLGGVLPPHMGVNPSGERVIHDWLWSVGAHPLSVTSTGLRYTDIQRDALARSYVLDAVDASVEMVNIGIRALESARISDHMQIHVHKNKDNIVSMLKLYSSVVEHWRAIMSYALLLEWGHMVDLLDRLNHEASEFHRLSVQVATAAEHLKCKGRVNDPAVAYIRPILSCSALVAGAAMVFAFMPRLANFKAPRLN